MRQETWVAVGAFIGVVLSALALARTIARPLRRLSKQNDEFREDWYGEPARPGRAAVPGVPERLSRIENELRTNNGGTLRDAVNRVEARLDEHIRAHGEITK